MLHEARSENPRLIPGAPEALMVSAHYVVGSGWSLRIQVRRQFQLWAEAAYGAYDLLSTEELYQLIGDALSTELGLD